MELAPARDSRLTWTIATVRQLGLTTDLPTDTAILGIGRTLDFDVAHTGHFPVPIVRLGRRGLIPVPDLLDYLGVPRVGSDPGPAALSGVAAPGLIRSPSRSVTHRADAHLRAGIRVGVRPNVRCGVRLETDPQPDPWATQQPSSPSSTGARRCRDKPFQGFSGGDTGL
jgi:hypothetical protein